MNESDYAQQQMLSMPQDLVDILSTMPHEEYTKKFPRLRKARKRAAQIMKARSKGVIYVPGWAMGRKPLRV